MHTVRLLCNIFLKNRQYSSMSLTTKIPRKLIFYSRTKKFPLLRNAIKRLLKRHVRIQSIRDFALLINNIRTVYDSPIMGLHSEEYCGAYEINDLIVHSSSGLFFSNQKDSEMC